MNLQELLKSLETPVKHKVFVSYHHKLDQEYYDAFSTKFHDTYESIHDASLDSEIDSDDVDYVMRRIREEYIVGTSCTIVLIGAETYQRKYIDWEIKATLDKEHALLGIYLPSAPRGEKGVIVPGRLYDNVQSGYAVFTSWEKATASSESLGKYIADAKSKFKSLIANSREKKKRNG
ncbi:TIR domain-containing protein [Pseudomonas sp. IT-347P]|uniref:TIR domain-containing protein n=1 Tax=Pseudomonas sp. IT-347P TaxID=3026458 RepID=UPI0039DF5E21